MVADNPNCPPPPPRKNSQSSYGNPLSDTHLHWFKLLDKDGRHIGYVSDQVTARHIADLMLGGHTVVFNEEFAITAESS